jgi:hypothetical protein
MSNWTAEAQDRWSHLSSDIQQHILTHVWCSGCQQSQQMDLDGGAIIAGDLVIAGRCPVCGHRMARLLEHEDVAWSSSAQDPFQPGEKVIWMKRLPGGAYVVPLAATVIAVTPKRVKIIADDDGHMITRFVPGESLQHRT